MTYESLPTDTFTITPRGMFRWAENVPAADVVAECRRARGRLPGMTLLVRNERTGDLYDDEGAEVHELDGVYSSHHSPGRAFGMERHPAPPKPPKLTTYRVTTMAGIVLGEYETEGEAIRAAFRFDGHRAADLTVSRGAT